MNPRTPDAAEQVVQFSKEKSARGDGDGLDQSGEAIVALLQQAANLANENCDRAMSLAHKLSIQLRAAEDRVKHLQAELQQSQDRSARAEKWLNRIYREIEDKLISPRTNSQAARH
jgi:replicative superfamily II helicase